MRTLVPICLFLSLTACGPPAAGPTVNAKLKPNGITPGLAKSTNKTLYNLEFINKVVEPLVHQPVSIPASEQISITGWAVDQRSQSEPSGVEIAVDTKVYRCTVGLPRADVSDAFKVPAYGKAGFSFSAPAEAFGRGNHQLSLRVIAHDGKTYFESPPVALKVQ